ncbi:MAG: amidohydrolase [Bacillota bacterium]
MHCDILIHDSAVLTKEFSIVQGQSIAIAGENILKIGPAQEMETLFTPKERISGKGKLAMPGFIDGHTHTSQQLLRGMISDEYPVIYLRFNIPYESRLNEDDVRLCTQLSCLEMIKSGITAFADAGGTYLPAMIEAVSGSGLRASITRATSDIGNGLPANMSCGSREALRLGEQLYREFDGTADGRIRIFFQIRSMTSCSSELIRELAQAAREYDTGLHMHVSEYPESILKSLNEHGMREVEYLDSLGALCPNLLAAHCILLSDNDVHLLAARGVKVVHCPRSNLGKGITKTPQLLGLGVSVGLGSDGTAHSGLSMFKEITAFKHAQIAAWGIPYADNAAMPARTLLEMATLGSAKALRIDAIAGTLEEGKKADLILLDVGRPHLQPTHNLLNSLMEAGESADIMDMIVNGRVLMRDRRVLTLDEERLMQEGMGRIRRIAADNGWA